MQHFASGGLAPHLLSVRLLYHTETRPRSAHHRVNACTGWLGSRVECTVSTVLLGHVMLMAWATRGIQSASTSHA